MMERTAVYPALDAGGRIESATAAAALDSRTVPRVAISSRFLLGIYAVLPLCVLAMFLDQMFWGGSLSRALPKNPQRYFLFQLLFGTPHIVASSVILATNGKYFRAYRMRLVLLTLLILAFFGGGSLFIPNGFFLAVVGVVTVIHVLKQQVGVGKGLCRLPGRLYDTWGLTLVVLGSVLYYPLYSDRELSTASADLLRGVLWALAALSVVLTLFCHPRIKTTKGRLYLWANTLMVLLSAMFYARGYPFLAILGPRLVHDLTAFTFYVTHDVNRHGAEPRNVLYRAASRLGLGIFWVCPAVAVLLTYLIVRFADPLVQFITAPVLGYSLPHSAGFLLAGYLGLLHYYTEAFTWRQGSPYRRHVALTP
ncbi:MAG: hypothetical protein ACJ74Q_26200 [Pyrinomonadaceae bacterium]